MKFRCTIDYEHHPLRKPAACVFVAINRELGTGFYVDGWTAKEAIRSIARTEGLPAGLTEDEATALAEPYFAEARRQQTLMRL